MLLADMGATVLRLDRRVAADDLGIVRPERFHVLHLGRRSAPVDLKHPDGVAPVPDHVGSADALFEGFTPRPLGRSPPGPELPLHPPPPASYGPAQRQ